MTIAIIAYFFPESTIGLAKHLVSLGHTVHYYYITDKKSSETSGYEFQKAPKSLGIIPLTQEVVPELHRFFEHTDNIELNLIRLFNNSSNNRKWNFLNQLVLKRSIRKILKKTNYDAINLVGHHTSLESTFKLFKNKRLVHTLHEVNRHSANTQTNLPVVDSIVKSGNPIIVHSKSSYDRLGEIYGDNSNAHLVPFSLFEIYQIYDKELPITWDFEKDTKTEYILNYGFISDYKGVDILIKAFNKIKDQIPNTKLIIAGGGMIKNEDEIDHNRTILINRYLTNAEIVKLNKLAQFIVCPYLSASQSGIPMVSNLFRKPLIATKVGAFTEVIEHQKNGILVEPGSVDQLADAILNLSNSREQYESLLKGVDNFNDSDKMNWTLIAKHTESIYKS